MKSRNVLIVAVMAALLPWAQLGLAQVRDPSQQKTDYLLNGPRNYSARAAGVRINNARQCTQQLYEGAQQVPQGQWTPVITKIESEQIGQTIQAAKQNLAVVKQHDSKPADPEVVKKVESIEKYLEAALKHHKVLDMECCKDSVDGKAIAGCCDDVLTNLDKALAEQASLLRMLGVSDKTAKAKSSEQEQK